ncbi:MAG: hypothetical protein F6K31_22250 [Symploca sp. SIO2G7]|nr:hypothetical protein [Symploca sp. SIO2G7]
MDLTFLDLAEHLPAESVEYIGAAQIKLNCTQISGGEEISLDSSVITTTAKLLDGMVKLTDYVNGERIKEEKNSIEFASKLITGTSDRPRYEYRIVIDIDPDTFVNNLIDPTSAAT